MESWELREWYADFLEACNRHDLDAIRGFVGPAVRRAHLPGGVDAFVDDLADLFHGSQTGDGAASSSSSKTIASRSTCARAARTPASSGASRPRDDT